MAASIAGSRRGTFRREIVGVRRLRRRRGNGNVVDGEAARAKHCNIFADPKPKERRLLGTSAIFVLKTVGSHCSYINTVEEDAAR